MSSDRQESLEVGDERRLRDSTCLIGDDEVYKCNSLFMKLIIIQNTKVYND